ncbi:MAG: sensor histidine kinase [Sphingobium sp.]|nr:sensor histidine kinase [Sphingobium sp.]
MRFNDLLRTVLAHGGEGLAAAVTRWRQCIDLVAQYDVSGASTAHRLTEEEAEAVFAVLGELSRQIGPEQRVASIVELGGRLRSLRLCRFLAQDHPAVVAATMARARLTDEVWASIIPVVGPLARSILRRRTDLGALAHTALARFGPSDLALPPAPNARKLSPANDLASAESADRTDEPSDIGKIVERIERFTATRMHPEPRSTGAAPLDLGLDQVVAGPAGAIDAFSFETDEKGQFSYVHGAPRAAVVGLTVGAAALDGLSGADGQALGAYRRRAAFRDARFAIASGVLAGEWRISGEPRFDRASGLFRGYSGSARREMAHEQLVRSSNGAHDIGESLAEAHAPGPSDDGGFDWSGLSATGARQLIHELRTPLSAIYAYAEMIEGQLVGPVSSEYREIAGQIIADARELVATFDDLDLAGRIARNEERGHPDLVDLAGQLRAIVQRFASAGSHRIVFEAAGDVPPVSGDREQIERMLGHLVRAGYAALGADEPLVVHLRHLPVTGTLSISIQRPAALQEHSEATLLDHASPIDQMLPDAPPLGLAFALRLVRGIAGRMGGQLLLSAEAFELMLPAANRDEHGREQGS